MPNLLHVHCNVMSPLPALVKRESSIIIEDGLASSWRLDCLGRRSVCFRTRAPAHQTQLILRSITSMGGYCISSALVQWWDYLATPEVALASGTSAEWRCILCCCASRGRREIVPTRMLRL